MNSLEGRKKNIMNSSEKIKNYKIKKKKNKYRKNDKKIRLDR